MDLPRDKCTPRYLIVLHHSIGVPERFIGAMATLHNLPATLQ